MTYKQECLEKFNKLPRSIRNLFGGEKAIKNIDKINQEFGVDIDFLVILLAIGELMIYDVDIFSRKKFNLSKEKSIELSSRINELIIDPAIDEIVSDEFLLDELFLYLYNKTFDEFENEFEANQNSPEFYLNILPNVLSSNIFYLLDADEESKKVINDVLIYLLLEEKNKKQIQELVYNNEQILFEKEFFINGKQSVSSVSNWIKDYINKYGIDKYEDLFLAEFISDSPNAKLLNKQEKDILNNILKFYLNLKFFPEIFNNVAEEKWNIFPTEFYEETKIPKISKKVFETQEAINIEKPKVAVKKVSNIDQILQSYKDFELKFKQLEFQFTENLKTNKNTDLDDEFLNFLKNKKNQEAMLVLSYVCRNNLLAVFFKDSQILVNEFKKYLISKFDEQVADSVINSFGTVESVSLFIQFLFNEKLRLSPRDSGLFGMYLANIFKKSKQTKYFPIVYGDVNLGMFVFREIKDVAGKLTMK